MKEAKKPIEIGIILIRGFESRAKSLGLEIAAGKTHVRVISTLDFKAMHNLKDDTLSERTALSWARQELMRCTRNATGGEVFLVCADIKDEKHLTGILEVATFFEATFGILDIEGVTPDSGHCAIEPNMTTTLEEVQEYVGN